ncbi:MAG: hypothetical protein QOG30_3041 [Acidimicrobiaceae bacterium]
MTTRDVILEIRRASRPNGVATDETLQLTPRQKQLACRNGILERRHRGVYVDPAAPRTPLQDLEVAIAIGGYLASGCCRSAAAVWRMIDEHPSVPEIVIPRTRHGRVPGAVVRRSSALSWDGVLMRGGVRVTKPLLTAVDLGVRLSPMDLAEVVVGARQLKLFEPDALRAEIGRIARPGRNGIRTARAALELVMIGDRPADSVLELRFHHGPGRHLPPYEYQWPVRIEDRNYRIDFAYPSVKLAIEVLGYDSRKSRESLDYEVERTRLLVVAGWTVLPATWTHVKFQPDRVASDVLARLGALRYSFGR